ncbi:MAG TPA: hypothetical protein VKU00_09435 [Chthonomonadaceae bacterium]|nr:hypothetical protein [Chthonomonadaceae bacterium]
MNEPLQEFEGTWEEVAALGSQFTGRRVRLILLDDAKSELVVPQRPAPTPEQARLGILPPAVGSGSGAEIMRFVRSQPRMAEKEFEEFERAIAENRAMRRQLAQDL